MSEPQDLLFTRDDILTLTEKLGEFAVEKNLNKGEWGLLLAVFAAAANHVEVGDDTSQGKFSGVKAKGKAPTVNDPEKRCPPARRRRSGPAPESPRPARRRG